MTSLSQRIAERMKQHNLRHRSHNLITFLALRADIEQALTDGWSVQTVWQTLKEEQKIAFGYTAFRTYVNRLIRCAQPAAQPATDQRFIFNPIPNAKDLL